MEFDAKKKSYEYARKRLKADGGINGGRRDASRQTSVLTFPGGSAPRAIKVNSLCTQRGDTRFVIVLPRWWREKEREGGRERESSREARSAA